MNKSNIKLIECESCGHSAFELIRIVEVTQFFEREYKKEEGFTERIPNFFSERYKLRCANCGVLFKENE
jgi:uncharacterized Zn finger protein